MSTHNGLVVTSGKRERGKRDHIYGDGMRFDFGR